MRQAEPAMHKARAEFCNAAVGLGLTWEGERQKGERHGDVGGRGYGCFAAPSMGLVSY